MQSAMLHKKYIEYFNNNAVDLYLDYGCEDIQDGLSEVTLCIHLLGLP